ncbi:DNA translocase FtsK [bacterium]|nr:DNA translocase FtsK [bacterium]
MGLFSKKTKKKKTAKKKAANTEFRDKIVGSAILLFTVFIFLASISYMFSWKADQSVLNARLNEFLFDFQGTETQNFMGKIGAWLAHLMIYNGFGLGAFLLYPILFLFGINVYFKQQYGLKIKTVSKYLISAIWLSMACAVLSFGKVPILSGLMGYGIFMFSKSLIGLIGVIMVLALVTILFAYVAFGVDLLKAFKSKPKPDKVTSAHGEVDDDNDYVVPPEETLFEKDQIEVVEDESDAEPESAGIDLSTDVPLAEDEPEDNLELQIEEQKEEEEEDDPSPEKEHYGIDQQYDPTLDLRDYKFPKLEFLNDYGSSNKTEVTKDDLEKSKNMIVQTLENYKIAISQIKATIGPTVTLFEIVPEKGVRISKIKNLEDDIALSLAALGIRIIAPIPGKGTIGIEVPNKKPEIVSMHSMIASSKYNNTKMELPVCLGKTIANEVYLADLTKMPHLLMAGATGQGKSVGLNAIIVSLLYKKHPAELKFVMVDPKKVELTLFNNIERHYLAKLPGEADAIITDNKQVITTLNSLCVEMDQRYELLQNALVRNIKEYNVKFMNRKLNPEDGHRFLPYIVVVIDEVADLIMTAGKEVEHPIARLAQLARAIGIHLILATQRPSVNIITGTIKANFPARVAFRVSSKIDSRTILDTNGADQLIGKGDMLYSTGSEIVRLQCPFVDTPEVSEITDFIGAQRGYPDAFILPEVRDEEGGESEGFDPSDRDALFEDAARIVVQNQQGSTSLLQRRLKVGYNRAGRLIDQLEAANIVGPFEGSKARSVLLPDEYALEQFLSTLN